MKDPYTHICVLLDRSGSMEGIRDDTVGGFNAFVEQQKKTPGTATLSLVQFDTQDPFEVVHAFVPVRDVPPLTRDVFVPRGGTPLLDAMGRAINHTEEGIAKMADFCRPDTVIIAIITDGQENSSHEFKRAGVVQMIEAKQKLLGWKFVYLSADLKAIADAIQDGIKATSARAYSKTPHGTLEAWNALSESISDVRTGESQDIDFRVDPGGSSDSDQASGA
jgi:uncharacterized protein YegL